MDRDVLYSQKTEALFRGKNQKQKKDALFGCKEMPSCLEFSPIFVGNSMKVRASVKADKSKGDKIVRRKGVVYVINKKDPTRKQRQKGPARIK